ncbi:MAG: hypothetical protein JJU36_08305 [Phycisphaeraceae bacterium]|nr:hypothetical protein [Phycisphaeraceae bacterium]
MRRYRDHILLTSTSDTGSVEKVVKLPRFGFEIQSDGWALEIVEKSKADR